MSWIRLRQIALVAHDLESVVGELRSTLGLDIAHRDPAVAAFGLHNAVLPVGNQFVEVVSPTRDGTAGGRQLDRLGGDGGYMVIGHTDDHEPLRKRVAELGVRVALESVDDDGYHLFQLHPADTGGSFLELDFQPGGDDPAGPWMPAGDGWQSARRTDVVDAITGVTVQSADPDATVRRWAAITDCSSDGRTFRFDNATITFVDGPLDSLVAATLRATDPSRAGEVHDIGGVRFELT